MDARPTLVALALVLAVACAREEEPRPAPGAPAAVAPDAQGHTPPTGATVSANAAVAASLALDDPQDLEDARRGLVASEPQVVIEADDGRKLWITRD
jgi:alkyl sulfatase BDS1-like metallo-beta-lactamase superfamily hydrolase